MFQLKYLKQKMKFDAVSDSVNQKIKRKNSLCHGKKIPVWNLFTVTHTVRLDCLIDVVDLKKTKDYTFSVNEDLINIHNYFCSKSRTYGAKFSGSLIWKLLRVPFGRISWPTGGYRRHTPRRPDTADCSSNAAGGHSYPTPPCGYPSFCADPAASRHRSSRWAPGTVSASSLRGTHTSSSAGDTPRTFPAASPSPRRSGWSVAPGPVRSPPKGADPYPHPPEYTGGSAGTLSAPPPNQKTRKLTPSSQWSIQGKGRGVSHLKFHAERGRHRRFFLGVWSLSATHEDTGPCTLCDTQQSKPCGWSRVQLRSGVVFHFLNFLQRPIDGKYCFICFPNENEYYSDWMCREGLHTV